MPPPPSSQGQGDNSTAPLWALVALCLVGAVIWYFFHTQIVAILILIRWGEIHLISFFTPRLNYLFPILIHKSPAGFTFGDIATLSEQVGDFLRYPLAAILLILSIIIFFGHTNLRFKKRYTMDTLVDVERKTWPCITPVEKLNLSTIDIDQGPWAMALSPLQFVKKHNLLVVEPVLTEVTGQKRRRYTTRVKRDEAFRTFAFQMGNLWEGIEMLEPHTKALFAVFQARAGRDKEGATQLLNQLALSSTTKLDFTGTDKLIIKHQKNKEIKQLLSQHAYVLGVMASLLVIARKDGVLASAEFIWLKPVDRPLWFMLNCVGRQTPFPEIAGPFSHWIAEKALGRPLKSPMVEEAVKGLEVAMTEIIYIPDENVVE